MTYDRFQTYIGRLDRAKEHGTIDTTELATYVITAFGWHAAETEEIRHTALDFAGAFHGEEHILHTLKWMRNTWPHNKLLERWSYVAISDYDWFEKERTSTSYYREKGEFIGRLKHELVSLGIPSQFQRFIRNVDEIQHWFVVTF